MMKVVWVNVQVLQSLNNSQAKVMATFNLKIFYIQALQFGYKSDLRRSFTTYK